jgi:hypothetical protein
MTRMIATGTTYAGQSHQFLRPLEPQRGCAASKTARHPRFESCGIMSGMFRGLAITLLLTSVGINLPTCTG